MQALTRCDAEGVPFLVQEYVEIGNAKLRVRTCEGRWVIIPFADIANDVLRGKCHIWPCADLSETLFHLALEEYVGINWQRISKPYLPPRKVHDFRADLSPGTKITPQFCVGD